MCCNWFIKLFKKVIKKDDETFTLIERTPSGSSFYEILLKTESPYEYPPVKEEKMTLKAKGRNMI